MQEQSLTGQRVQQDLHDLHPVGLTQVLQDLPTLNLVEPAPSILHPPGTSAMPKTSEAHITRQFDK